MKKMKRVLSLALAMVMLLGMVMVPTGAVSTFTDADMIENTEAVAITSGIGLFAGTTDGQFAPKAAVTRAQMATIIVKMLRGSDFNADSFKGVGVNPFPDTAAFEGGWAEGYINACYQMGAVAGYGDGTFQPGNPLTTAEAVTMIINALGVDPGPGDWPTNYMAKAEELKLYGEMATKPGANVPLTRDQLAVLAWEGLQYSPEGKNGWKIPNYDMVFESYADAKKANGNSANGITQAVGEDSLASKVYEIETATGWITKNQATGEKCTVLSDKNGEVGKFGVETGVDMLGHYVTVYYKELYKSDKQPGEVYTIVDESSVAAVYEAIATSKDYKAAFETRYNMAGSGSGVLNFDNTYDCYVSSGGTTTLNFGAIGGYNPGTAAPAGTYIIYEGEVVSYIRPADTHASYIAGFNNVEGEEEVFVDGQNIPNSEDDDKLVEYEGMAKGDFVTYTIVNGIYVLSPVEKVTGEITKTSKTKIDGVDYNTITINGEEYPAFEPDTVVPGGSSSKNKAAKKLDNDLLDLQWGQTYAVYVAENGRYIGFELADSAASLTDTVYLLGTITTKAADRYDTWYQYNKARGVDMDGNEVLILLGKQALTGKNGTLTGTPIGTMAGVVAGFYTVEDSTDKDEKEAGIQLLTAYTGKAGNEDGTYATKCWSTDYWDGTGTVWTIDGLPAKAQGSTRFLIVDGELDDDEPLTVTASTGGMEKIYLGQRDQQLAGMLVSENGTQLNVTAFVLVLQDEDPEEMWVYVSAEQLASKGTHLDGALYPVYQCSTGSEIEVILDPGQLQITTAGFARLVEVEAGTGIYKRVAQGTEQTTADTAAQTVMKDLCINNVGYYTVTDNSRLRFERMKNPDGSGSFVDAIVDLRYETIDALNAKVYDLRSDTEISNSGVSEITSVKQIMALHEADPGLMVVFDVALNGTYRKQSVKALFIKEVVRDTVGMGSIIYAESFGSDTRGNYAEGFAVSTVSDEIGDSVKVYAEHVENKGAGFYRYTVTANGKISLLPFDVNASSALTYGMVASHKKIDNLTPNSQGGLEMQASRAEHSCTTACGDTAFEARSNVYLTEDTLVYDTRDDTWHEIDYLAGLWETSDVYVDYFCAQGVMYAQYPNTTSTSQNYKDDTARLVVITGVSVTPNSCTETDHSAHTKIMNAALTDGVYTINASGTYYLGEDITGKIHVTGGADVTLCMNGHNLTNEGGSGDTDAAIFVDGNGSKLSLENCKDSKKVPNGIITKTTADNFAIRVHYSGTPNTVTLGDGVHVDGSATSGVFTAGNFYLEGGTISNNNGRGVQVATSKGHFYMNGGTISGNDRGVYVSGWTETEMTAGSITQNKLGVEIRADSKFMMSGGTIAKNTNTDPSGVHLNSGTKYSMFQMTGGTVDGGASGKSIRVDNTPGEAGRWTLNLTGGTLVGSVYIAANSSTARINLGAVQVMNGMTQDGGTMIIDGATFKGALAVRNSGTNATIKNGTFTTYMEVYRGAVTTIEGGTFSAGVTAKNETGKVAGTINIKGGTFTGNVKATDGGVLNITGGKFANNVSSLLSADYEAVQNGSYYEVKKKS